jgi:hypothetical protein
MLNISAKPSVSEIKPVANLQNRTTKHSFLSINLWLWNGVFCSCLQYYGIMICLTYVRDSELADLIKHTNKPTSYKIYKEKRH